METHQNTDDFVEKLKRKVESCKSSLTRQISIFRVPPKLRRINPEAYTPQVVSIGPFHRGNPNLAAMEYHKLNYLHNFLQRVAGHKRLEDFAGFVLNNEASIRCYYADVLQDLSSGDFCEIILVDSIFILELFKKDNEQRTDPSEFDFIVDRGRPMSEIAMDLILLENQVPFFVLTELYGLAFGGVPHEFRRLTGEFFTRISPDGRFVEPDIYTQHFTDLARNWILPELAGSPPKPSKRCLFIEKLRLGRTTVLPLWALPSEKEQEESSVLLYSVSKLREAGVRFKAGKKVRFEGRELTIPLLQFDDLTDLLYRNVIALEQLLYPYETRVCHYVKLLDHLINTAQDVDFLVERKILDNRLGENQAAADVVNKLSVEVAYSPDDPYKKLVKEVNAYYQVPWNAWKANLMHEYFSTPWSIASTIAAFILLALTFTQTLFTVLQYKHR